GGRGAPRGGGGQRRGRGERNPQADGGADEQSDAEPMPTTMRVGPSAPIIPVTPDADDAASDTSANVCFICADPVRYSAIAPCNHATCHICSLRLRALYKTKACAHCRVCDRSHPRTRSDGR